MTPSELKYLLESAAESRGLESHFFDRKTMRFFGDTMRNFGVRAVSILANFDAAGEYHPGGVPREVWELYRRRPVKAGNRGSFYFDRATLQRVHCIIR